MKILKLFDNDEELKLFFAQLDENIVKKYSFYFSDIIKALNQVNDGGLKIFLLNLNNKFLNELSDYNVKNCIISLRTKDNLEWFFRRSKNIENIKVLKTIEYYLSDIFSALETKEKLEWFLGQLNDEKNFKLLNDFKSDLADIFSALKEKEKLEWFLDQLKDEKKVDLFNKFIKNLSYLFRILETKEKLEWFVNNSFENYKNTELYIENSIKIYKELNQFFLYFISYEIIDSYNQDKNAFKDIKLIEAYNQILNELLDSYKIQLDEEEKNEVINYIESSEAQTNYLHDKDYNLNYFNSASKDIDEDLKNEIEQRKLLSCIGFSFKSFLSKIKEVDKEFNQIHLLMLLESIDQIEKRIKKENKYWFFESFVFNMKKERLEELKPIIKNLGFFLIVLNKLIDLSYLSFDNQSNEQKFFDLILNQVIFSNQRCLDLFDKDFMIILNYFCQNPGLNNFFLEFCFIKDDFIFNNIKSIIIGAQNSENTIDDQGIMNEILNSEKTNEEILGLKKAIILNSNLDDINKIILNIDLEEFVPLGLMHFNSDIN